MRGLDDGPDGLNDRAFDRAIDRALGIAAKPKRARKPKPSPFAQCRDAIAAALNRLDAAVGTGATSDKWVTPGLDHWPWIIVGALRTADEVAAIFDGIREACR